MNLNRYHPTNQRLLSSSSVTPWSGLESEISRLVESALSDFAAPAFSHRFPVDLYEDAENTYVRAELPGLQRSDVTVELADGFLTINGARRQSDEAGQMTESVALNRSIAVSDSVATDRVKATYEDGILTVTLPKREEAKRRKLNIDVK